jgi:hypothetical protein
VREDPLTGETSRICHFAFLQLDLARRSLRRRARAARSAGARRGGDAALIETLLAGGRSARGGRCFPNLFPYDDVSAIVSMQREHFAPMDALRPAMIAETRSSIARDFIREAGPPWQAMRSASSPGTTCRLRAPRRCIRTCK